VSLKKNCFLCLAGAGVVQLPEPFLRLSPRAGGSRLVLMQVVLGFNFSSASVNPAAPGTDSDPLHH
jgi:hypothetical protein